MEQGLWCQGPVRGQEFSWGPVFEVLDKGDLGEWYLVKKEEDADGGVLGDGSFLRREGMPVLGERTKRKGV